MRRSTWMKAVGIHALAMQCAFVLLLMLAALAGLETLTGWLYLGSAFAAFFAASAGIGAAVVSGRMRPLWMTGAAVAGAALGFLSLLPNFGFSA